MSVGSSCNPIVLSDHDTDGDDIAWELTWESPGNVR